MKRFSCYFLKYSSLSRFCRFGIVTGCGEIPGQAHRHASWRLRPARMGTSWLGRSCEECRRMLGQPIIVVNKPGAGSSSATASSTQPNPTDTRFGWGSATSSPTSCGPLCLTIITILSMIGITRHLFSDRYRLHQEPDSNSNPPGSGCLCKGPSRRREHGDRRRRTELVGGSHGLHRRDGNKAQCIPRARDGCDDRCPGGGRPCRHRRCGDGFGKGDG